MGMNLKSYVRSDIALLPWTRNPALNCLGGYQRQPTTRWLPILRAKGRIVEGNVEVEE